MTTTSARQQTWQGLMASGMRSFRSAKPEEAAQWFKQATELSPDRVEGWINLGSAMIEATRYDAAAVALQRAVDIKPTVMLSHLLLGDAFRLLGELQQARMSYQNAVAIERSPLSLNKLACALRVEGRPEFAEGLYQEALDKDPGFTLARVNHAIVQLEMTRYDEAEKLLAEVAGLPLPPKEKNEVESAQRALADYLHLKDAIASLLAHDDLEPLHTALRSSPGARTDIDEKLWPAIQRYAESAEQLAAESIGVAGETPKEWPRVEALCVTPMIQSAADYKQAKSKLDQGLVPDGELRAAINMEAAIRAARSCGNAMRDPVQAELHLRHWHALACREISGHHPGHFKYTQNWVPDNPSLERVEPALASATFRRFISEVYSRFEPGIARAALVYITMADLHVFINGNTRTSFTWLNRELEWSGNMPAIYPGKQALKGELHEALTRVNKNGGDLSPLISAIQRGQQNAVDFCTELARD